MSILTKESFELAVSEVCGFSLPSSGMYFPLTKKIKNSTISIGGDLSVKVFRNHLAPVGEDKEIYIGEFSSEIIDKAHELCI